MYIPRWIVDGATKMRYVLLVGFISYLYRYIQISPGKVNPQLGEDYGLNILTQGNDPTVDIVMVHGLNGHWKDTWTADNQIFWAKDLLPGVIPNARIFSYGYDARTHDFSSPLSQQSISDYARALITDLATKREITETERRPIIFVAHSLGGIVVKSALIHSDSLRVGHLEKEKAIKLSTYGILFMGTPHQGGEGVSLGQIAIRAASLFYYTKTNVLEHLEKHSEWLQQQQIQYLAISNDFVTKFFYETRKTPLPGGGEIWVVPKYSAVIPGAVNAPEIDIPGDHKTMVRYRSSNDRGFKKVSSNIFLMVKDAPEKINGNWANQDRIKEATAYSTGMQFRISFRLEYPRNNGFTGRSNILDKLHEHLKGTASNTRHNTVALYGPGGIGKTQIALEYAHEHKNDFSSVFWIDATNQDSAHHSFLQAASRLVRHHEDLYWFGKAPDYYKIAATLGMVGLISVEGHVISNSSTTGRVVEAMKEWLVKDTNRDWLLVFDNVDDLETFDIRDFFPQSSWGSIIITTRRPDCARFGIGIEVEEMTEDEGLLMLKRSANLPLELSPNEYSSALELVKKLDFFPLAIEQAGAYISVRPLSLKEYIKIYENNAKDLLNRKPPLVAWSYRNDSVFTTWEVSFTAVQEEDPQAAELLLLCGFLAKYDIWEELLRRGRNLPENDITIQNSIHKLSSYSLIKYKGSQNSFNLHTLVHFWAQERLDVGSQRQKSKEAIELIATAFRRTEDLASPRDLYLFTSRVIKHIDASFYSLRKHQLPGAESNIDSKPPETLGSINCPRSAFQMAEGWYLWTRYIIEETSHYICKRLAESACSNSILESVYYLGFAYRSQAYVQKAEDLYRWTLAEAKIRHGKNHPFTLKVLGDMAWTTYLQGRYKEALELYQCALCGRGAVLGRNHPSTMGAVLGIAAVFEMLDRFEEALKLYDHALTEREKILGKDDSMTLNVVTNKATLFRSQQRYGEALQWYERALATREKTLGKEHSNTLDTIHAIGVVFHKQGQYEEALGWYKREFAGREKTLGEEHPATVKTANTIILLLYKLRRYDEALTFSERTLGEGHLNTLDTIYTIGLALHDQAQYEEAFKWYKRAFASQEKTLGEGHPNTLRTMNKICKLLLDDLDRYDDALLCEKQALAIQERTPTERHSSIFQTIHNIGWILYKQERYEAALEWYQRALAGREKTLGEEHSDTLQTIHNIAIVLYNQERYEEALEWYQRALAGREKTLGEEHSNTLDIIYNIGLVLYNQERYEEALEWYQRALAGREKTSGEERFKTLDIIYNIGLVLYNQERYEEALEWYQRALAGREKTLGEEHSNTLNTIYNIGLVLYNQERYEEALKWFMRELAGREKLVGIDDSSTLETALTIGQVLHIQKRYDEALEWCKRAFAGSEKVLGLDHDLTLRAANEIILVFSDQGRHGDPEALEWNERAVAIKERRQSKDQILTLD